MSTQHKFQWLNSEHFALISYRLIMSTPACKMRSSRRHEAVGEQGELYKASPSPVFSEAITFSFE